MSNSIYTTRKIPLSFAHKVDNKRDLIAWLQQMAAVKQAHYEPNGNRLSVEYDLLKVSYKQLLSMLDDNGIEIRKGFVFSLMSDWFNYIDKTAKSNALAPPPSCCNKPPPRQR